MTLPTFMFGATGTWCLAPPDIHPCVCVPPCFAVNLPGFFYGLTASGDPTATACPEDTYGLGLRKQRACPACPTGFITYGKTKQTNIQSCSEYLILSVSTATANCWADVDEPMLV